MTEPVLGLPICAVGIEQEDRYLQGKWEVAVATRSSHSLPSTARKAVLNKQHVSLEDMEKVSTATFATSGKP